ncbi:general substrate transporter [Exidia glandulosa HHB12029]|uniref:General substrate transporter n=1 Tax=Exidia glandulosa HHB12029 TaxID=1314781 RepID=A0A165DEG4_EXIGL|nr:general substrate transporter [Exidia glandulosa HHB12029]
MTTSDYVALPSSSSSPSATTRTLQNGGHITVTSLEPLQYTYAFGRTTFTIVCALLAALGGISFGYDQGVIANVLVMPDFVARFPATPAQVGWMTAILELGALLGALGASAVADRWSRRYAICLASAVFCVGSTIQAAAWSFDSLTFGRAVGGIGIGALSMLAPLYITEISAPDVRGRLLALEQLAICTGVVMGFWAGFFTRSLGGSIAWRLPLAVQAIPGVVLGIGCLFLPPSPRYLVLRDDLLGAQRSLARLRNLHPHDALLQLELLEIRIDVALSKESSWSSLWTTYRPRTLIGMGIGFFQPDARTEWTGINALLYYGPTLMAKLGLEASLVGAGGIGIVQVLAVGPALGLIDSAGRRPLLIYGAAAMAIMHASVSALTWKYDTIWDQHALAGWTAVGLLYLFTMAYGVSFGPVTWVLPAEVFPTSIRSRGIAVSTASTWFNNFLVGLLTPVMLDYSAAATYAVFACACVIAGIWAARYVPETRGLALEEVDRAFGTKEQEGETEARHKMEEQLGLGRLVREIVDLDENENEDGEG